MTSPAGGLVDGVDVDAVAAAVRSCAGVDDLDGGPLGSVATYLPGRRVPGIQVMPDLVTLQVRGMWGVPVGDLAVQIRVAVAPFVGDRSLHIVVADLTDPPSADSPAHEWEATLRQQR